jgi:hypothetical protein
LEHAQRKDGQQRKRNSQAQTEPDRQPAGLHGYLGPLKRSASERIDRIASPAGEPSRS